MKNEKVVEKSNQTHSQEQESATVTNKHEGEHANKTKSKKQNPIMSFFRKRPLLADAVAIILIVLVVGGALYWNSLQGKIYIEKAEISAPIISLSSLSSGIIERYYVEEGDTVAEGQPLVLVGNQTITAKTKGIVIWIKNTPGEFVAPAQPLVKVINPNQFRLIGRIEENKGLSEIQPGQKVVFTVDAFGNKEYVGTVESVAPSSRDSDIVFSISTKREVKEFDVKVIFDSTAYSELKNGMSAKMSIYK